MSDDIIRTGGVEFGSKTTDIIRIDGVEYEVIAKWGPYNCTVDGQYSEIRIRPKRKQMRYWMCVRYGDGPMAYHPEECRCIFWVEVDEDGKVVE